MSRLYHQFLYVLYFFLVVYSHKEGDFLELVSNNPMGNTTGDRIKYFRITKGLTQKELSDLIGVRYQTLQFWESGKRNPKIENVSKIADVLKVDLRFFYPATAEQIKQSFLRQIDKEFATGPSDSEPSEYDAPYDDFDDFTKITLTKPEWEVINRFRKLSEEGQGVAIERMEELAQIPKYQKKAPTDSQSVEAAEPDSAQTIPEDTSPAE